MINPWRMYRSRAVIIDIPKGLYQEFSVKLQNGHILKGYDLPAGFKIGETVNIKAQWSVVADRYTVRTVRKIRKRKKQ